MQGERGSNHLALSPPAEAAVAAAKYHPCKAGGTGGRVAPRLPGRTSPHLRCDPEYQPHTLQKKKNTSRMEFSGALGTDVTRVCRE